MSLREIANHANVSTATVSRVINGVPTVNRNLAKRVWKAVGERGYSANSQARCVVSGKSRLFGLVISDMRDPFFPEIVQSFEAAAIEFGCETLVTSTLHDPKRMELSVRRMVERRIEGAAVLTFGSEEVIIENLRAQEIAAVFAAPQSHTARGQQRIRQGPVVNLDQIDAVAQTAAEGAFVDGPIVWRGQP